MYKNLRASITEPSSPDSGSASSSSDTVVGMYTFPEASAGGGGNWSAVYDRVAGAGSSDSDDGGVGVGVREP